MNKKTRGSEKVLFNCEKNGKRSLADFENVEEALQACGGAHASGVGIRPVINLKRIWWRFGIPAPDLFRDLQNFQNISNGFRR